MANLNIYINKSLQEDMAKVNANWTEVCRQAIKEKILKIVYPKIQVFIL